MHAAMRAKRVLRHAGAEGVGGQRVLASQQVEIGGLDRQVRQSPSWCECCNCTTSGVEIDLGAETYLGRGGNHLRGFRA